MNARQANSEKGRQALGRLLHIAAGNTGQAKKVADFLLAWHNTDENGGWDPVDLWSVDAAIADDILTVLHLIRASHCYPPELGFEAEITKAWEVWRSQTRHTRYQRGGSSAAW